MYLASKIKNMSAETKNLSQYDPAGVPDGSGFTVGIVVSEYHSDVTFALRDACIETLKAHKVEENNIVVDYTPGSFELPMAAQTLCFGALCDAVIVLGCVIKGDTDHDVYISQSVSQAIMTLSIDLDVPFIFGLLTTNDKQQALDRAGGSLGNKGTECAVAALKMLAYKERYQVDEEELEGIFEEDDEEEEDDEF